MVVLVSVRLARKIAGLRAHTAGESVSLSFLAQSYLSTILLFGGCYFVVFLLSPRAFDMFSFIPKADMKVHYVLWECMYFSFTTMTFTGYGDIYPTHWLCR